MNEIEPFCKNLLHTKCIIVMKKLIKTTIHKQINYVKQYEYHIIKYHYKI